MGKTYEALEWAEKQGKKKSVGLSLETKAPSVPTPLARRPSSVYADVERYDDLKTNLFTRRGNAPVRTILFTGIRQGSGCSTTAVHFSYALAKEKKVKVLLMDVNLRTPSLHDVFHVDRAGGVSELLSGDREINSKIRTVGPDNICVITCGGNRSEPARLIDSSRFDNMLELINGNFNYVILDGPPILSFSESKLISSKVDGVVLVLEAGKTRRQVAMRAKRQIEEAGGKILGVVLNKRKYYIPDWLYDRL